MNDYNIINASSIVKKEYLYNGYGEVTIEPVGSYINEGKNFSFAGVSYVQDVDKVGYLYYAISGDIRYYELRRMTDFSLLGRWEFPGGAACPYVFIDEKYQGTILYNLERIIGESVLFLKDVSNIITIKELEDEQSFFEWIKLYIASFENGKLVLKRELQLIFAELNGMLVSFDGIGYIYLNKGDILTLQFENFTLNENEVLILKAKGWYRLLK